MYKRKPYIILTDYFCGIFTVVNLQKNKKIEKIEKFDWEHI